MLDTTATKAARVRASLDHPIIDADGHFVELGPLLDDEIVSYLEEEGGAELREAYRASARPFDTSVSAAGRDDPAVRAEWRAMPSWWGWQCTNTRDRATAHLPRLLYERLDEIGIDFTILYPSMALGLLETPDADLAAAVAKAVNRWFARCYGPYADRIAAGAIVPMHDPDHAVGVLRHAVTELGCKTIVMTGYARRYLGEPDACPRPYRLDTFGIDSEYDYDPFWAACVELGVAPVSHSSLQPHRVTRSVSSYVYNHVGGLGAGHESLCKSLFLGGVTRRFPGLRVGFLEGGVAWACSLLADLVGHWEKRNGGAISDLDPSRLDVDELVHYLGAYGDDDVRGQLGRLREYFTRSAFAPPVLDEFAACQIETADDIRTLFEPHFYFGCEADDPLVAWAFASSVNALGARLRPMFGSDISHWDVPDMTEPVAEAWELVERGTMGEPEFREFTFLNPLRMHAGMNPGFFRGTVCEAAAADALVAEA